MNKNIFNEDKFEEILIANWSKFFDNSKFLAYVFQTVKQNTEKLTVVQGTNFKSKGLSVTLSRFSWTSSGFIIWVEFYVPIDSYKTAEGTLELLLNNEGTIIHLNTIGNLFSY